METIKDARVQKSASLGAVSDAVSHTAISPLLAAVTSTDTLSDLLSMEGLQLSPSVVADGLHPKTSSPLLNAGGEITVPTIMDVAVPTSLNQILDGLQSVMTSAPSSLKSTNTTMLQAVSSWSAEELGAVVIIILMVPFILLSNIFVILSVVRFRRLHTPTNYFIISLAAVDIFVALATPFGIVVEVFHFGNASRPRDVVLCLIPNRVLMMACGVSVLTLATIAYDRHTALVSPLEYVKIMTSRKVAIMVTLTWIYSVAIVWLPLMAGWYDVPTEVSQCSANLIHGKAPLLFLSAIFVPSCVAILVCYFRIFMVARHHAKAIAAVEFALYRRLQVKFMIKDTKYAKTLALVIGVFLVLWLPYLICIFLKTVSSVKFDIWVQTYLILLAVFNSGINPWIYAFKNNELKSAFKRLFVELCRNRLCPSFGSRTNLVSAVNGTPRLSLSDSRIISIIPEVTSDMVGDNEYQNKTILYSNPRSGQVIDEGVPPFHSSPKYSCRQAARCSSLDELKDPDNDKNSLKLSRSVSVDIVVNSDPVQKSTINASLYLQGSELSSTFGKPVCSETLKEANRSSDKKTSAGLLSLPAHNGTTPPTEATSPLLPSSAPLQLLSASPPRHSQQQHLWVSPTLSLPSQCPSAKTAYPSIPNGAVLDTASPHHPGGVLYCCVFKHHLHPRQCPQTATLHTHFDQLLLQINCPCESGLRPRDSYILSQTKSCPVTPVTTCQLLPTVIESRATDITSSAACLEQSLSSVSESNCRTTYPWLGRYV